MLYVFLTDCMWKGMVSVLNTNVVIAMVSHLEMATMATSAECCESMQHETHKLVKLYHGKPVASWANRSTVCMYRLKNHTSSRAASQPSSSTPATALSTALGSNSESLMAASSTKSVALLAACLLSPLLKDLE